MPTKTDFACECAKCLIRLGYGNNKIQRKLRVGYSRTMRYRSQMPAPAKTRWVSYRKHPIDIKARRRRNLQRRQAKAVVTLSDWYITRRLRSDGFKISEITPELLEVKRLQLAITRAIREHKQHEKSV